jgi:hypothetical protein
MSISSARQQQVYRNHLACLLQAAANLSEPFALFKCCAPINPARHDDRLTTHYAACPPHISFLPAH